ncbi:MAG TPA: pitrilysin family protein [Candidatus Limnocylindria bacterium]|nr:pitrilysin family protein [Candidatus Limnocylindria bacterium]
MASGPAPLGARRAARSARRGQLQQRFNRDVLPNGLRVVTQEMPHARSVAIGLFVGVGSRYEQGAHAGLSHMLEHLVFKGTQRFPDPGELSEAVEGCGGSVNASTDRELTVYSAKVPANAVGRGLDVVSQMVLRPTLRGRDLAAEKPVIIDEIRMYEDSPGDHVFTLFDGLLFGRHPLGREIAGTPGAVRRATRPGVVAHWRRWYRPQHLVLAVAGATTHAEILAEAASWFADGSEWLGDVDVADDPELAPVTPSPVDPGAVRVGYRRLAQGNLCLGMPGVSRRDPDRWALDLLGALLGDGMSSRLFLELRERRSLAYDVSTFAATYADCGTFGVHAGFDPAQANRVVRAILDQLERVVQDPVPGAELERARAYVRGRLDLRMEDTGAVAAWLGTGESLLPRILTVDEVVERLEAVTPDDVLRVARRFARPDQARLAVLGPFRSRARFERLLAA